MRKMSSSISAFPLAWPITNPRTPSFERRNSQFKPGDWKRVIGDLRLELKRLGADNVVISTNQPIRQDGEPFTQTRRIDDPGVAVYFTIEGQQVCFPCDRWLSIAENLRAVTLHIYNMRAQDRYGVGTSKQAFAGYKALQASNKENWWDVLQCDREDSLDIVQGQYRRLFRTAHPDSPTGDHDQMTRLNVARDEAIAEKQAQA